MKSVYSILLAFFMTAPLSGRFVPSPNLLAQSRVHADERFALFQNRAYPDLMRHDSLRERDFKRARLNKTSAADSNVALVGRWATSGGCYAVFVEDNIAYIGNGSAFEILDVVNPARPVPLGQVNMPSIPKGIFVSRSYAYVADGFSGLRVIDVRDPSHPVEVSFCRTNSQAEGIYVMGDHAYVADGDPTNPYVDAGLRVIDVSDPSHPEEVSFCRTAGQAHGVYVSGSYAYVADGDAGLEVIDVGDPWHPRVIGQCDLGRSYPFEPKGEAWGVYVSGSYAYVANWYDGLRVVDVRRPFFPVKVGFLHMVGRARGIYVSGTYAYVVDGVGLRVIDVKDPSQPVEVGFFDTAVYAVGVYVYGNYVYVADGDDGVYILQFNPPSNLAFSGRSIEFDGAIVGSTSHQAVTLMNNGQEDVAVHRMFIGGANADEFSLPSGSESFTLAPSESRDITIQFNPQTPGDKEAYLIVESNAASSPDTVRLSGTGIGLEIFPRGSQFVIQRGEEAHIYVRLITNGSHCADIPVAATIAASSVVSQTDENGVAEFTVNVGDLAALPGSEGNFTVVAVNDVPLQQSSRPSLNLRLAEPEITASWNNREYFSMGVGLPRVLPVGLHIAADNGSEVAIVENPDAHDTLIIGRQLRGASGVDVSPDVGAAIQVNMVDGKSLTLGTYAGVRASGEFANYLEDRYRFDFDDPDQIQAGIEYLILANGLLKYMSSPLTTLYASLMSLANLQESKEILSESWEIQRVGYEIKGSIGAQGEFGYPGAGIAPIPIEISPQTNLSGLARFWMGASKRLHVLMAELDLGGQFTFTPNGQFWVDPYALLATPYTAELNRIWSPSKNLDGHMGFAVTSPLKSPQDGPSGITLSFSKIIDQQNQMSAEYRVMASPTIIKRILEDLRNVYLKVAAAAVPGTAGRITATYGTTDAFGTLQSLFAALNEYQRQFGELGVRYRLVRSVRYPMSGESVQVHISPLAFSASVGGGTILYVNHPLEIEDGVWLYGKHYPIRRKVLSPLSRPSKGLQDILQTILDRLPPDPIQQAISVITRSVEAGVETVIEIGKSTFTVTANALQAGTLAGVAAWAWAGGKPWAQMSDLSGRELKVRTEVKNIMQEYHGLKFGIGGFYQLLPQDSVLHVPSRLTIAYSEDELEGANESSLAMYYWDAKSAKWRYYGGTVDTVNNTVTALIDTLYLYTLAPTMPYGDFILRVEPDSCQADGQSQIRVTSSTIRNNDGSLVADGTLFAVSTTLGSIINDDLDPLTAGIQVASAGGKITFRITAPKVAGVATLHARSLGGESSSSTFYKFYDHIAPQAPQAINARRLEDSTSVEVQWNRSTSEDVAGYVLYYGTQRGGPYNGTSKQDLRSPIVMGPDTFRVIRGLAADSAYFFRVQAYDVAGNRSELSNEVSVGIITGVARWQSGLVPSKWNLAQNYPNPFNPVTIIRYDVPVQCRVQIHVWDLTGRMIATLVDKVQEPGEYMIRFYADDLPAGMYLYGLRAGSFSAMHKMILLK